MASTRFQSSFGNDRNVEVNQWKGKLRVDIREWKHDKPTKKEIQHNSSYASGLNWFPFCGFVVFPFPDIDSKLALPLVDLNVTIVAKAGLKSGASRVSVVSVKNTYVWRKSNRNI